MSSLLAPRRLPYLLVTALLTALLTWLAWNTNAPRMGFVLTNASDPLGYYHWLPGTFLKGDWSTLPYVHYLPNGKGLSLFTMGVAIMQAPFFLLALLYCKVVGITPTGFELPFVFARLVASASYCSAGAAILFNVLRRYWSTAWVLISLGLLLLGTNLYYYAVHDGGMSHIYSFFLFAALLLLTLRLIERPTGPDLFRLILCGALIVLIRPLNGIVLLIPLLYGNPPVQAIKVRLAWIKAHHRWAIVAVCFALLLILPQLLYWKKITGSFFVFTYGTKEEGFDWSHPHLWDILFSHQGGWLLYHPLMIGAMAYLIHGGMSKGEWLARYRVLLSVWVLAWYAYASWWNWWLGGSFGHRGFVEHYGYLALPFAAFVHGAGTWAGRWRWALLLPAAFLVFLNIRMGLLAFSPMDGPTWTWDSLIRFWGDALYQ